MTTTTKTFPPCDGCGERFEGVCCHDSNLYTYCEDCCPHDHDNDDDDDAN